LRAYCASRLSLWSKSAGIFVSVTSASAIGFCVMASITFPQIDTRCRAENQLGSAVASIFSLSSATCHLCFLFLLQSRLKFDRLVDHRHFSLLLNIRHQGNRYRVIKSSLRFASEGLPKLRNTL